MNVTATPPPRSSIEFFGESHFAWAPKKPCRPQKAVRGQKPRSRRSLDFSSIPMEEEKDENMSLKTTRGPGRRVTRPGATTLPTHERKLNVTPGRPDTTSLALAAGLSIARRIDFAAIAVSQNDTERASMGPRVSTSDARRFIAELETTSGRGVKSQNVEEFSSIGNSKSTKRLSNQTSCTNIKRAKLTRLMR